MILVTGATGFVGRQVVRSLVDLGQTVRLVIRTGSRIPAAASGAAEIIETPDLFQADSAWLQSALAGVDTIIHAAWYAEPGEYLHSEQNLACLSGTIALARACIEARVRRVVGVGTCLEYDLDGGILKTDTPLRPRTLYAASKASVFHVLTQLLPRAGVEFAWCRLFYLYGEGEDPRRLVPYLRQRLASAQPAELTSGYQIRDYLDVQEAGSMIARVALDHREGPFNVCSGLPVTVRQLAERIADEYGHRDLLRFGARPENVFDPPCIVGVCE